MCCPVRFPCSKGSGAREFPSDSARSSRCAGDSRTNGYPFPVRLRIRRKPRLVCQVRSGTAFTTSGAVRGRSFGMRRFRLRSGRYRGGAEGRNAKRRRRRSLPVTRGDGRYGFARRIYRRRFAVADPRAKQEVRVAASSVLRPDGIPARVGNVPEGYCRFQERFSARIGCKKPELRQMRSSGLLCRFV